MLYTPADFKFSFYYRTNSFVLLPSQYFNEYIKGSLSNANQYDYYVFTVQMNTERIVFTLKSHFTHLVINLFDNGKPMLNNTKWHMKSNEHQLIISSSEIGIDSLRNTTFIIGAVIPSIYDITYSNYKFRILPQTETHQPFFLSASKKLRHAKRKSLISIAITFYLKISIVLISQYKH